MKTGRAVMSNTLSRVLFALAVIGVVAFHSLTVEHEPVVPALSGPVVVQLPAATTYAPLSVDDVVGPWHYDAAEIPFASPVSGVEHCGVACVAFLSVSLMLLGWFARPVLISRWWPAHGRAAMAVPAVHDLGQWLVPSPAKLCVLRT
ncbi:hypothetical protein FB561_6906 [Kribbella amoyensis]|uniref:Uncharacterized protein n=1 Tax=Kribbella amoyensis TaxID=996641 RepID=A0A561B2E9_9ACTN|nr:hypothetical protein [Kribbella amoyensis]TWD73022.1 hypothetical protein FB561_6906 [Kribbella amoyensis]